MAKTCLNKWHYIINDGDTLPTYTCDSWEIPEAGTDIWCTGWKRGQVIKPYGDGCHVIIGFTAYHCDELMGILERWEQDGEKWGIEGVEMTRRQQVGGRWIEVRV